VQIVTRCITSFLLHNTFMRSWALVTGGGVRLGREICLAFAKAGWNVACHYNLSESAALNVCDEVRALGAGAEAVAVQGALDDEASCHSIFDVALKSAGHHLHCIVNNASLFVPDTGDKFDEAEALSQLKVNLMAPMHFGKWLAELHRKPATVAQPAHSAKPSLVHVLDQKVFNLNPDYFTYTLSKLALERAVSLQAQSLAPTLRVNAVSPGLMYLSGPQSQTNFDRAAQINLLQQAINPADVARSVVFLAESASTTGTTLRVDNGQHLVPLARDVMFVVEDLLKP
jgi:NAD(P)-dependent dehydrogenase (short-subunit alcohol dehydrogenase family)